MKLKFGRLLISCLIISVIGFISFFVYFAYEESGNGDEFLFKVSGLLLHFIFYPAYLYSSAASQHYGPFILFGGGVMGVILDSLLIELLINVYHNYKIKV